MVDKEEVRRLLLAGVAKTEIARLQGCSRQTIHTISKEFGATRYRSKETPSVIGFTAPAEHRLQWAHRMFSALDAVEKGEEVSPTTRENLEMFLEKTAERTWTYSEEEGFFWVTRKPEHQNKLFIKDLKR